MAPDKTRRSVIRAIGASGIGLTIAGPATAGDRTRYVVASNGNLVRTLARTDFSVAHTLAEGDVAIVTGPSNERATLVGLPGVKHASTDRRLTFQGPIQEVVADDGPSAAQDPTGRQWDKHVTETFAAHQTATGNGSRLAIVDSGIQPNHPDLAGNVNTDLSRLFQEGQIVPDAQDADGHGTHVAGIAAADGLVVGTAPDAELVSLRVFWEEDGYLTTTSVDILLALEYAAAIDADAANLSLGTPPLPPRLRQEGMHVTYQRVIQSVANRGTAVVAAAGNDETDLQHGGMFSLPNSVPGAMSISATGPNDKRSFYSNYGTNDIDVGAPGGGYETMEKTLEEDPEAVNFPFPSNLVFSTYPGGYAYLAGTSMAAPQVTGAVGLLREVAPEANIAQIERQIAHGAEGAAGRSDPDLGAGRLNVRSAVEGYRGPPR
jgi:subtilisin family serine protease